MAVKENDKYNQLNLQLQEVMRVSNDLNLPLSIAIEVDNKIEQFSNEQLCGTEAFTNIKTLHQSLGIVEDFLLAICATDKLSELNKVKSTQPPFDFTITNQQVRTTTH
ncbi:hypothetical protein [Vibrio coralliilyticus]|uniref:Uncharacterized protein n=1 Tax=Vibrio coralliilyticus TaxID=190893 RepID=A0AAP6ZNJ3_9VIBR|nr:hypothetical protein [Vibrio coralliilyticus]NOI32276.1 hypothetical protein [Vibrio coralliilyticus]NOJ25325.1 hypothetical protein [Vibrio coralliilyticus]